MDALRSGRHGRDMIFSCGGRERNTFFSCGGRERKKRLDVADASRNVILDSDSDVGHEYPSENCPIAKRRDDTTSYSVMR